MAKIKASLIAFQFRDLNTPISINSNTLIRN